MLVARARQTDTSVAEPSEVENELTNSLPLAIRTVRQVLAAMALSTDDMSQGGVMLDTAGARALAWLSCSVCSVCGVCGVCSVCSVCSVCGVCGVCLAARDARPCTCSGCSVV